MEIMWIERLVQKDGQWQWEPQLETFDLQKDFGIEEDNLAGEMCRMGQLLVRYGGIAAEQSANLARKDEYAKLVNARVSAAHRSQAEKDGGKPTADKLKEMTTIDPDYQKALSQLHILRADAVKAEHWWRAIVKKAELLNALAFRQNAEIRRMS